MSSATDVIGDAFTRIGEGVLEVVDGLSPDDLARRITPDANPIGWLVWHLLRVQDDSVADVAGAEQVWHSAEWAQRFALPFEPDATGYGQSREDVSAVRVTADLLVGYARGVTEATHDFLRGVSDDDLDRVVDERWDPPVTLGVRLVSVIADDLKHLGQAEYAKGLL
ncbi:mycothiol transferase [Aeromicrobium wangtongii]|uniref:DinB family protein n=1 Tax=Aeromicrobium wangtongii TaxID=2969247 RepID=A0ABY5M6K2_9ACTN|nr:DUF664 domain-containing protein [Aeromicrobium wangtongii]MCD9199428.1 DinB family protein [Aeromicrobium wangtongii]UUP13785.1 DinB family protein [Aeromicrobium wangtongii]